MDFGDQLPLRDDCQHRQPLGPAEPVSEWHESWWHERQQFAPTADHGTDRDECDVYAFVLVPGEYQLGGGEYAHIAGHKSAAVGDLRQGSGDASCAECRGADAAEYPAALAQ